MLDSGANNYLVHVEPSQETEKWEDTLFLAWGTCRCNSIQGPKGIPTTQVEKTGENDESLCLVDGYDIVGANTQLVHPI